MMAKMTTIKMTAMKTCGDDWRMSGLISLSVCMLLGTNPFGSVAAEQPVLADRPNVIVVMADDLGKCYDYVTLFVDAPL